MEQRIQKIIAAAGLCSRRKAEDYLSRGLVTVNGRLASLGDSADPERDTITVNGTLLAAPEEKLYLMLNKPRGYITTLSDEQGRKTVLELVADAGARLFPVGRLDRDTDGLLLMTNDGELSNRLMHPRYEHEKTYLVHLRELDENGAALLRRPIVMDGKRISPPDIRIVCNIPEDRCVSVTIHEGRNRQVRRMCEAAGLSVLRLTRVSVGPLELGDLPVGSWRRLTLDELNMLSSVTGLKLGKE